ncbi:hypothetical protein TELCIR_25556, partial [Teladorsagia circumcincta]
ETRWKGAKAREIREGFKLYYSGEDPKRNGVVVAVAESLDDYLCAVSRISDLTMAARIHTKEGFRIILPESPQSGCPETEKDEFYLSLDDVISSTSEGNYLAIAGDLNGHVRTDREAWNE